MEHFHQFVARLAHFLHTGEDKLHHYISPDTRKQNLSRLYHGGHIFYFGAVAIESHGSLLFIAGGMALLAALTILFHAMGD